jgi:DNA-directed RNA polymerase specialized sigma subunit
MKPAAIPDLLAIIRTAGYEPDAPDSPALRRQIMAAIATLDGRAAFVLALKASGHSTQAIATTLGVTPVRVGQIHAVALRRLTLVRCQQILIKPEA